LWLDYDELGQLEKSVSADVTTETTLYARRESDINCPKCGRRMTTFNYRAHNLPLDYCVEHHGWWLDKNEDRKVVGMMEERIRGLSRSRGAQQQWRATVGRGGRKTFLDKLRDLFR
jgi:Zn-finger nucleic acid-binding protein